MLCLEKIVRENSGVIQEKIKNIEKCRTLKSLVLAVLSIGKYISCRIIEEELKRRNSKRCDWPKCRTCGKKLESKGNRERTILTLVGKISFKRKIGRCKNKCKKSQISLLDKSLGIIAYQKVSNELQMIACILAVFIPYDTCSKIMENVAQISVPTKTLYRWCRHFGKIAYDQYLWELYCLERGLLGSTEMLSQELLSLPLVIGGDGVMVPFRPFEKSPKGKISWREVKVGIFARLKRMINDKGISIDRIVHKRLVAVLGDINIFQKCMELEAHKQQAKNTKTVAWISDGGRGFWTVFDNFFSSFAIGILDFYHAAQYFWKFAKVHFDGRTKKSHSWFKKARRLLKKGDRSSMLDSIGEKSLIKKYGEKSSVVKTFRNLNAYLLRHKKHTNYPENKDIGLPIGSGMVESACKWLVQSRFKGVGMRWSEEGFNHLLHLRLAWVNERFEHFF